MSCCCKPPHCIVVSCRCLQRYKVSQTLPVNPFLEVGAAAAQSSTLLSTLPSSSAAADASDEAQPYDDDVWVLPQPEKVIKKTLQLPPPPAPVPSSAYCSVPSCSKKARCVIFFRYHKSCDHQHRRRRHRHHHYNHHHHYHHHHHHITIIIIIITIIIIIIIITMTFPRQGAWYVCRALHCQQAANREQEGASQQRHYSEWQVSANNIR